jgi:hypothetical protein
MKLDEHREFLQRATRDMTPAAELTFLRELVIAKEQVNDMLLLDVLQLKAEVARLNAVAEAPSRKAH